MTLEKAIEILTYSQEKNTILITLEDKKALRLGVEALKRIRKEREIQGSLYNYELPGETKV